MFDNGQERSVIRDASNQLYNCFTKTESVILSAKVPVSTLCMDKIPCKDDLVDSVLERDGKNHYYGPPKELRERLSSHVS